MQILLYSFACAILISDFCMLKTQSSQFDTRQSSKTVYHENKN
jgi:hypothetical protein